MKQLTLKFVAALVLFLFIGTAAIAQIPTYAPSWTPPTEEEARAMLEGLPFAEFAETAYRIHLLRSPQTMTRLGAAEELGVRNDRLDDYSESYLLETQRIESLMLQQLRTYDRQALSETERITFDILRHYWQVLVDGHEFLYDDYLVTHLYGGSPDWLLFDCLTNEHPMQSAEDAVDFLARLSQVGRQFDQLVAGLETRRQRGIIAPRRVLSTAISKIYGLATTHATQHPVFYAFALQIGAISDLTTDQKQEMLSHAIYFVTASAIPGYQRLYTKLTELESEAPEAIGIQARPHGKAYYEYALDFYVGNGRSADELYDFALDEIVRLQQALRQEGVARGLRDAATISEIISLAMIEGKSILNEGIPDEYQHLVSEAKDAVESAFSVIPEASVMIVSNPFYVSFYRRAPLDGSRRAEFSVRATGEEPKYMMPTMTYQQTYPGHHLQIALALEADLPLPQQLILFPAHTNGWGAYAEQLAWELDAYNPENTTDDEYAKYGNIGRLSQALNRAVLMAIDLGIHTRNWTYDEARGFFAAHTGIPAPAAETSLLQILVAPGETCSTVVGYRKLLDLRSAAQAALGDQFTLTGFHDVVLGSGSLPMSVLEQVVEDYIEARRAQ